MVMGNLEEMMACAARTVAEEGGVVAVAGLMSPEPYEDVAERSKAIGEALVGASESGFGCVDPFEYI